DGVIGDLVGERVVRGPVLGLLGRALGSLVGATALLGATRAGGGGVDLDRVATDPPSARALGQPLELVGGEVDRLEMALVLELAPGGSDVGVPDLGLTAPRQLDVALVKWRLELQEEQRLLE